MVMLVAQLHMILGRILAPLPVRRGSDREADPDASLGGAAGGANTGAGTGGANTGKSTPLCRLLTVP